MQKKKLHKKKPGFFKKTAAKLHLWFGLSVGAIVFVISITGALYVFKDEIESITRKEVIHHGEINISKKQVLPMPEMEKLVNAQVLEKYPVHWVDIPIDKSLSYRFHYYESNPDPKVWNYFQELVVYKTAYVNPFTGKVLAVYDEKNGFFNIVKMIHWSFLLKQDWGTYVVGIPTLIFLVMLITGIILWWPKNKAARKQRFWFRWKNIKNWKRKNYDLHNILGFYASFIALIVTITGLFYAFFAIQALIYFTFSGGKTALPDFSQYATKAPKENKNDSTWDKIGKKVETLYPKAYSYSLDLGHEHLDDHEHPYFAVYVKHLDYAYYKSSEAIFDENSGEFLHAHNPKDKNFGEKAVAANYDIHVGAIFGIWSKILAFISSLICASLPITGFLVWWGRRKKNKKPTSKKTIITD